MFTLLRRLRTAIELAERVEKLEGRVQAIEFEWTDVLDKLLAREERWRKRYRSEVNRALEPEAPALTSGGGVDKSHLRAVVAARQASRG